MLRPIKVVDVELSQPIKTIQQLENYKTIEILLRLYGRPIGKLFLPVTDNQCSATTIIQALSEQHCFPIFDRIKKNSITQSFIQELSLLELLKPISLKSFPLVTVAVCTRDRPDDLQLCLNALSQLEYPNLEILIIDNAPSTDETQTLVSQYSAMRYVREPRPGLSWARNRAIVEAKGDIIAYTDDDVMVDPGWVMAIAQVFAQSPDIMAVTGYVAAYELETKAQIVFEQAYRFGRGFQSKWVRYDRSEQRKVIAKCGDTAQFGTGANMAFRRNVFEAIGSFDPALGAGTITAGGEDLEMLFRILMEGYTLVYEPAALVRHRHRRQYSQLQKQIAGNGTAVASYLVCSAKRYPHYPLDFLALGWRSLVWANVKKLMAAIICPSPRRPLDLVLIELFAFRGLNRYPQARQIAKQVEQKFGALESIASIPPCVAEASRYNYRQLTEDGVQG